MDLVLFKQILDAATALTTVALFLCLYKFPSRSWVVKLQALNFLASVGVMLYISIFAIRGPSINIPQNLYIPTSILLSLAMYDVAWKGRYRNVTIVSALVFCVFAAWNFIYGQGIMNFNSYSIALGAVFMITHGLLYYYYLLVTLPTQRLGVLPMFWFSTGYLIHFAGSLFIFAAYVVDVLFDSLLLHWAVMNGLRIVQFILIIVGLCLDLRNMRLRSSLPSAR